MARGWESKSIESQVEDRSRARDGRGSAELSSADRTRADRLAALELSLRRVNSELASCRSDARRASLEHALAFLEAEIARVRG